MFIAAILIILVGGILSGFLVGAMWASVLIWTCSIIGAIAFSILDDIVDNQKDILEELKKLNEEKR